MNLTGQRTINYTDFTLVCEMQKYMLIVCDHTLSSSIISYVY